MTRAQTLARQAARLVLIVGRVDPDRLPWLDELARRLAASEPTADLTATIKAILAADPAAFTLADDHPERTRLSLFATGTRPVKTPILLVAEDADPEFPFMTRFERRLARAVGDLGRRVGDTTFAALAARAAEDLIPTISDVDLGRWVRRQLEGHAPLNLLDARHPIARRLVSNPINKQPALFPVGGM